MKRTYDVIVWIATINRETRLIEPKDILVAKGLRTKRSARKYIEFYKEEYKLKKNMYEILVSDGKESEMKTCADCIFWSLFDGNCWCSTSYSYLIEIDGDMEACEEFKSEEQEDKNEDDA